MIFCFEFNEAENPSIDNMSQKRFSVVQNFWRLDKTYLEVDALLLLIEKSVMMSFLKGLKLNLLVTGGAVVGALVGGKKSF